jgi:predicted N-acetyltransferase YhbS
MEYEIASLREQPQHLRTVAEWIHRQWWSDTAVESIEYWLTGHLGEGGFPVSLVALEDGEIVGSVSLHESEAEDRPAYKPYLGALFVKPDRRGCGLGVALVRAIEAHADKLDHAAIYLNAADAIAGFYEGLGWETVEQAYGPKRLNIMRRLLPSSRAQAGA